jgi:hypothetical protein
MNRDMTRLMLVYFAGEIVVRERRLPELFLKSVTLFVHKLAVYILYIVSDLVTFHILFFGGLDMKTPLDQKEKIWKTTL